ncbi:MAG: CRISPR-associated protein Csx15 [Chloroflexota bacterium]
MPVLRKNYQPRHPDAGAIGMNQKGNGSMILINLSHPLTGEQRAQIEQRAGSKITRLIERMAQFDLGQPFAAQAVTLVDALGLSPTDWQTEPLLLILPSLNFGAAAVLAELHGRCGYFPPMVRTRPAPDSLPPRYEVAEIVNLQAVRDAARGKR